MTQYRVFASEYGDEVIIQKTNTPQQPNYDWIDWEYVCSVRYGNKRDDATKQRVYYEAQDIMYLLMERDRKR